MGYIEEVRALVGTRPMLMVAGAVIVLDGDGRVLLMRRTDNGRWGLPGGSLEPGESFEQAARRELAEETGLVAGELRLLGVRSGEGTYYRYPNGDEVWWVTGVFVTGDAAGEPRPDGVESAAVGWFPLDALPDELDPAVAPGLALLDEG